MKLITSAFLLTLLFFSGCDQVTEINAPQERVLNKQLIKLPPRVGLGVETMTYTQNINGAVWTEFQRTYSYQTSSGQTITQLGDLDFFAGAFTGTKNISMTFNTDGTAIEFGPEMQFNARVEHTYVITGLDLTGVNPETLDFVYIDANGNMYSVEKTSVTMNLTTGQLKVQDAILPHFSRYGFVN